MKPTLPMALLLAALVAGCPRNEETDAPALSDEPVATATEAPTASPEIPPAPPPPQFDPTIVREVTEYYDTKSVMAGKARMTNILKLRMDVANETCKVAHVLFESEPLESGWRAPARADRVRHAAWERHPALPDRLWLESLGGTDRPPAELGAFPDLVRGPAPPAWHRQGGVRLVTSEVKEAPSEPTDHRTFEYHKQGGGWRIRSMGGEESASFGTDLEGWSDAEAIDKISHYYNAKGVWAGRFRLGAVARYRVDRITATTKLAYIKYLYIPLPGNPRETGYDKRTYRFEKRDGSWEVTWMGGHMSALKGLQR